MFKIDSFEKEKMLGDFLQWIEQRFYLCNKPTDMASCYFNHPAVHATHLSNSDILNEYLRLDK